MNLIRFSIYSLALAFVLILMFAGFGSIFPVAIPAALYIVSLVFGALTIALFRNITRATEKSPQRFVTAFMGAITVKLLLSAAFIGAYVYIVPEQKVVIALGTFVVYIANTILLVRALRNAPSPSKPLS